MSYVYIFICSFMLSLLFAHLEILFAEKSERAKQGRVSCIGGFGLYAAFLTGIVAAVFLKEIGGSKLLGIILASGLMLVLGVIDDVKDLRPSLKIAGEILGVFILMLFGVFTRISFLPLWLNILVTVLWVLFITNAFNLLDIMDGLASGLTTVISLTLLFISFVNRDIFSSFILIALIGSHLGFLKYNYPPAKLYMGDAGSLFSGFLLAALAINISYAPLDKPIALITPIVALSLPVYDTLFLIIMRLKNKKPVFEKTRDHFALRLVTMGYSVKKSVWIMYVFSMFLAVSSLVIVFSSSLTAAVMLAVVILVFILMGKRVGIVKTE